MLEKVSKWNDEMWLCPLTPNLTPAGGPLLQTLTDYTGVVRAEALTPDGCRAVSASYDKTLKVWDLENGNVDATFSGESGLTSCSISPDGLTIVAGEKSGRVHFLRLKGE